jgi:hypothetical protein
MALQRDDPVIEQLREDEHNAAVLDAVETASAHGDLGEVVFRYARTTGEMRVIPMANADFPALVATPADRDLVVVAAAGMRELLVRVDEVPDGARLEHEAAAELGAGWWRVCPFDAEVSIPDTAAELQRWFSAAARFSARGLAGSPP